LLASLEERSTYKVLDFFLKAGDRDDFKKVLVDEATGNVFALFWRAMVGLEVKTFPCF